MRFKLCAVALIAFLTSWSALGFEVSLQSSTLIEGQVGILRVAYGVCDNLLTSGSLDREVQVANGVVTVTVVGYHTDPPFCNVEPYTNEYQIGPFPKGNYVVNVVLRDFQLPSQTTVIGSASLGVVGNEPIPALNRFALALLVLAIAGLGLTRRFEH